MMGFRKDINGLRAIAVLSVVLFHFNHEWLQGGFAGVDVFFVISGYLMTSIIFRGIEGNGFSFRKFYLARAKRIIPALMVVCALLMVFGWIFLPPIPYNDLALHSGSSMLFISNFIYWRESGYFDAGSMDKFLLHTWSLSVEWQFYILYPIFLVCLSKLISFRHLKIMVVLGTVIGFIFSAYASHRWPTASYFLFPTRAWEMMIGGIAYLYPLKLKYRKMIGLEILGLMMIITSYWVVNAQMAWPGYWGLLPVLGTFLLLQANHQQSIITGNYIAQKIGLWSYSIYLVHWPVLVMAKQLALKINVIQFFLVTIILSVILFYCVEKRKFRKISALVFSIILLLCIYVFCTQGAAHRVAPMFQLTKEEFHRKYYGGATYPAMRIIYLNANEHDYQKIVAGDSYGLQYLRYYDEKKVSLSGIFHHGCLILPNYTSYMDGAESKTCSNQFSILKSLLGNNTKAPLILSQSWDTHSVKTMKKNGTFNGPMQKKEYYEVLSSELAELFQIGGKFRNYYLVGVPHRSTFNEFDCLSKTELLAGKLLSACDRTEVEEQLEINTVLSNIANEYHNVFFIDPNKILCTNGRCLLIDDNNKPIHSDLGHLSIYGAEIMGAYIISEVERIEEK